LHRLYYHIYLFSPPFFKLLLVLKCLFYLSFLDIYFYVFRANPRVSPRRNAVENRGFYRQIGQVTRRQANAEAPRRRASASARMASPSESLRRSLT